MKRRKRLKSAAGRMGPDRAHSRRESQFTFGIIHDTENLPISQLEICNVDRMTPDFGAYPWRGILQTLYHAIRRDLPHLEALAYEQLRKEARR